MAQYFYYNLCHLCKNTSESLKRCSSCKAVWYCSIQHQKLDWKNHRELCKAVESAAKTMCPVGPNCTFKDWTTYRVSCEMTWKNLLKRQLKPPECQMWMFPKVCNVCYSNNVKMIDCKNCLNVSYCCGEHKIRDENDHRKFCTTLKLCMEIDRHMGKGRYPHVNFAEIEPLLCLSNKLGNTKDLIDWFDKDEELERILKVDTIIRGAIISYVIEVCKISQLPREQLVIHIVGSSAAEGTTNWMLVTEFIFHRIENLQKILYIFIGPEAYLITQWDSDMCTACKAKGKSFSTEVHRQFYHEIANIITEPHAVIAFNCGLHEFEGQDHDNWRASIPFLVKNLGIPFTFTSYTEEELLKDLKLVRKVWGFDLGTLMCGKNPFASPRPFRDWSTEGSPIFRCDEYIGIVQRRPQIK